MNDVKLSEDLLDKDLVDHIKKLQIVEELANKFPDVDFIELRQQVLSGFTGKLVLVREL